MIEYSYKHIRDFNKLGIVFDDGKSFSFEECRINWASDNGIRLEETVCVGERNMNDKEYYFVFYARTKIKVTIKKGFFSWMNYDKKIFNKIQRQLNRFGYMTYDCS